MQVTELVIYPIKGARGSSLEAVTIGPMGLDGDRVFTLLFEGKRANQKQVPKLVEIQPTWMPDGTLCLSHISLEDFILTPITKGENKDVDIYSKLVPTIDQGNDVANWLAQATGKNVRLVKMSEAVDWFIPLEEFSSVHGRKQEKFIDAAPILLTNENSLHDLNERLQEPVLMDRFRANIVVAKMEPYQEDQHETYRSLELVLTRVTVCERCIVTTMDQRSGSMTKEPLNTMSRYRKRAKGYAGGIVFGSYLTTKGTGILKVGTRFEKNE